MIFLLGVSSVKRHLSFPCCKPPLSPSIQYPAFPSQLCCIFLSWFSSWILVLSHGYRSRLKLQGHCCESLTAVWPPTDQPTKSSLASPTCQQDFKCLKVWCLIIDKLFESKPAKDVFKERRIKTDQGMSAVGRGRATAHKSGASLGPAEKGQTRPKKAG